MVTRKKNVRGPKIILNTGQKFGELTVLKAAATKNSKSNRLRRMYTCKCSCGIIKDIRVDYLVHEGTKSCGSCNRRTGNLSPLFKGYKEISSSFWSAIKTGAQRRKIVFDLSIEYVYNLFRKQNRKCYYTGTPLTFPSNKKERSQANASLDRIDSNKGYTEGNVQWVDKKVNRIKHTLSDQEFKELCRQVTEYVSHINYGENID